MTYLGQPAEELDGDVIYIHPPAPPTTPIYIHPPAPRGTGVEDYQPPPFEREQPGDLEEDGNGDVIVPPEIGDGDGGGRRRPTDEETPAECPPGFARDAWGNCREIVITDLDGNGGGDDIIPPPPASCPPGWVSTTDPLNPCVDPWGEGDVPIDDTLLPPDETFIPEEIGTPQNDPFFKCPAGTVGYQLGTRSGRCVQDVLPYSAYHSTRVGDVQNPLHRSPATDGSAPAVALEDTAGKMKTALALLSAGVALYSLLRGG